MTIGAPSLTSAKLLRLTDIGQGRYLLGSFDSGITAFKQQIRTLNLIYSIHERASTESLNIAVIGGGIAASRLLAPP
jgi:hypothetical protein